MWAYQFSVVNQRIEKPFPVPGDRDPGYGSTAKMLAQAGICLAQDITGESVAGGFLTPATAMGDALIARLSAHAGVKFEIRE
jgi:saccharopine dehydrogenase (NAD+, L-glutamate forming)